MKLIIGNVPVTCMNDTMKYIRKHYPNTYLTIEKLYVLQSEITYGFKRFREIYYLFSVRFQGKPFNIMVIQVYALTSNAEEAEVELFYEDLLELTAKKDVLFIIGNWNAKVGSQETPGVRDKFGLRVQNEAGQRLIEFHQENTLVIANTLFHNTREGSTHGHHQMVNIEIRLIKFFATKEGEVLYSQQNQDKELTVAKIMNSLLPNSDLN